MKTNFRTFRVQITINTAVPVMALLVSTNLLFISFPSYAGLPKNLEWRGTVNSNWDNTVATNWFDTVGHTNAPFTIGDIVTFDDTGIGNPVNITNAVEPGSVTISANNINYIFSGAGSITNLNNPSAGTNVVSLTKNNNATLTIQTTNGYTGVTTLNGGVVSVGQLANGGVACAIGAASAASTNLAFNGGQLQYTGANATFNRGATLSAGGGTVAVSTSSTILTNSGIIAGVGGLTVTGSGTLALSGGNSYSGGTTIAPGTPLKVTGGGLLGNGNVVNSGVLLFAGTNVCGNNISGSGILTNASSAVLLLSGNNTFSGNIFNGTTNLGPSTLIVSNSAALPANSTVTLAGGNSSTLELAALAGTGASLSIPSSVTLIMETGNNFVNRAQLSSLGNPCTWNGPIQLVDITHSSGADFCSFSSASAAAPLIINGNITIAGGNIFNGNAPTFAGVGGVVNGTISAGPAALFNINSAGGSWTINSSGNIWGISDIANGKIILGANNALDPNVPVEGGGANIVGILDLGGYNQQVAGLTSLATGTGNLIVSNSSPVGATLTYNNPEDFYQSAFVTNGINGTNYPGTYTNFAGIIAGKTSLTVAGGVLSLSGVNGYSGATTISNGTTLILTGNASISRSADILVGPNATLNVAALSSPLGLGAVQTLVGAGGTGTLGGNIYMQAGSSLVLNYDGSTPVLAVTNGTFTCTNSGVVTVNVPNSLPIGSAYSYLLVSNGPNGTVAGTVPISVIVNGVSDVAGSLVINGAGLCLTVTSYTPKNLEWRGAVSTNWDIGTTNWFDTDAGAMDFTNFATLDNVIFDDNAGVSNNMVNLAGMLQPGMITVSANNTNYTFNGTGGIVGASGLTMSGNSTLTILTTNSYTGVTALNRGVVSVGQLAIGGAASAIGAAGSEPANVSFNGGELQYTGPSVTIDRGLMLGANGGAIAVTTPGSVLATSGTISGNIGGALTVGAGSGIFALAGVNSYNGLTVVSNGATLELAGGTFGTGNVTNSGTLLFSGANTVVNNITGAGVLTNAPGAALTLSGTNSYTGNVFVGQTNLASSSVTVANNAALAPNTTVTVGSVGAGTLNVAAGVSTPTNVTLIQVSGNVNVNRSYLTIAGAGGTWNGPMILEGDGMPGGDFANITAPAGVIGSVNGNTTAMTNGPLAFNGQIDIRGVNSQGILNGRFTLGSGALWALNDGASWILNSQSNSWGISDLANGKVTLGVANALPINVPLEGNSSGTVDLNGNNQEIAGLGTAGSGDMLITNSSSIYATLTYSNPANFYQAIGFTNYLGVDYATPFYTGTYTNFPGFIRGNMGLTVAAGWLSLSSANAYTGVTLINSVLALTSSASIANSVNIIIGTNALFSTSGQTLSASQTLTGSGGAGTITGNLGLGSSSLVLDNYVTNVPALTVSNGTLAFTSGNAVTVNVSGSPTLAQASYLLIATTSGGVISGTLPSSVTVNGAANAPGTYGAYLSLQGGQLYLTISQVPVILAQFPVTYTNLFTLYSGASPIFSIPGVSGAPPFTYQWFTNGVLDGAATGNRLQVTNVRSSFANDYCVVGNIYGTATSVVWSASVIADPLNLTGSLALYPSNVLSLNPIGYWRLNEADDGLSDGNPGALTHDYTGGNDALYTNVNLGLPGYNPLQDPSDTSALFGSYPGGIGSANSIQGIDVSAPSGSNGEFTVEAWVNATNQLFATNGIVTKGYFGQEEFSLDASGPANAFHFEVRNAAGTVYNVNSTLNNYANGLWYHLAGVCDQTTGKVSLYINGALAGSAAIPANSGVFNSFSTPMAIGARALNATSSVTNQFYGNINDVAVFNYALSSNQIAAQYQLAGPFAPTITSHLPVTYTNLFTLFAGANPNFKVTAVGTAPFSYQWFTNGVLDGAATANSLTWANVQAGSITNYCIVTNIAGSATSAVWTASVVAPAALYPQTVVALNPVGYWRLNEPDDNGGNFGGDGNPNAVSLDYAGGNDGLYTNVILSQPGYNPVEDPSDTSALFGENGPVADSYAGQVQGVDFSAPNGTSKAFTIEAWTEGYNSQSYDAGIVTKGYGNGGEQFDLDTGSDGGNPTHAFRFLFRDAAGTAYAVNSTNATSPYNAVWYHLAGVVDEANSNMVFYINGLPAGRAAISPNIGVLASTYAMSIGSRMQSASTNFNLQYYGYVNDVAVFNYALSPVQVASEYASGASFPPVLIPIPPANASANANATLTIPATAVGTPPISYVWTNVTTGAAIATGSTNTSAVLNATLNYANVPASWNGDQLELTVSNAYGMTNAFVTLSIVNVNPAPTNIVFSVTNNLLYLNWPADHIGWQLQVQTNSLSVGLNTNWVNYNPSTTTNRVVIPINLKNGTVFYRLMYTP